MRKVGVIVCSDKCYEGLREDKSGEAISEIVSTFGYAVEEKIIVPDVLDRIKYAIEKFVSSDIALVLTTGGTGFSQRDVTPEATKEVIEKEAPGIAEAIRQKSLEKTDRAMLSRAIAGIKGRTLIINLPGSEKAVRESLEFVMGAINHGLDILLGEMAECGR